MTLELTPFAKALKQLQQSLTYLDSTDAKNNPELYAQFRGACIQAFEYSYELAFKMIRRQLAQMISNPHRLAQSSFAEVIRMAADAGLIEDVKRFLLYRDKRNQTSLTYDENTAEQVVGVIPSFFRDANFFTC